MNRLICAIVGFWRTLKTGNAWSGHDYVNQEENVHALVTTSKCEVCGKWTVDWTRQ